MTREHRRWHLSIWAVLAPAVVILLALALADG